MSMILTVKLIKKKINDLDNYYLHVVTMVNNTDARNGGVGNLPSEPEGEHFRIAARIIHEGPLSFELDTPVVHVIDLGAFPFSAQNNTLELTVADTTETATVIVNQGDAMDGDRPIDDDDF